MEFRFNNFPGKPSDNWRHTGGQTTSTKSSGQVTSVSRTVEFEFTIHYDDMPGITIIQRQLALNNRFREIQAATYIPPGKHSVGFLLDNNERSRCWIDGADAQVVYIDEYPFPQPDIEGGDYATSLSGRLVVTAVYNDPAIIGGGGGQHELPIIGFRDTVTTVGNGGPRYVTQEYVEGEPEKFKVADRTKCTASQQGEATYEANNDRIFPNPLPPIFNREHLINESEAVTKSSSEIGEDRWANTTAWNYQFEAVGPLSTD